MNKFSEAGFLSSELEAFERTLKEKFPKYFDALLKTNRFCQRLQYGLKIPKNNPDKIIAAILFMRTLATYQAMILVARRGMNDQTRMLLRCMFESLFPLVAISKAKGYSSRLIGSEEHERLRAFQKLLRFYRRKNPKDPIIGEIEAKAHEVKERVVQHALKKLTIAQCAEDAGLIDWYDTAYAHLSMTVHASARSLEDSLILDLKKDLKGLKNEPQVNGFEHLFATAIEIMQHAVVSISTIFDLEVNFFVSELSEIIKALAQEDS